MKTTMTRYLSTVLLILIVITANFAENSVDDRYQEYLKADTNIAKGLLHKFTESELAYLYNKHIEQKNPGQRRNYWLMQSYFERKENRIAEDRLFYLALGLVLLFLMIVSILFALLSSQKKLAKAQDRNSER